MTDRQPGTVANDPQAARERVLYAVVCAAPPAADVGTLVGLAQAAGWDVHVIATPDGRRFIDVEALAEQTGNLVRSAYTMRGEVESLPPADGIIVAPATFNTVNKFRHGIADTLAAGILCEAIGLGTPVVLAPNVKAVLAAHPAFGESLSVLAGWGVRVMEQSAAPRGVRMPEWPVLLEELSRIKRTVTVGE